jgi:uncharacterized protein (DUF1499 family)
VKRLNPCPSSPNCVSTLAHDQQHAIAPIKYQKDTAHAHASLKRLVLDLPRVKLVEEEETYLHFEFTSRLLRFVDDVEFLFEDQTKTIHFRSASRIGYGDFGVNRRRMEEIRNLVDGKI